MSKLKFYIQRDDSNGIIPIKLRDLIAEALEENVSLECPTVVETDGYSDNSGTWIEVKETREDKEIALILMFDDAGEELNNINLYETPIKKVVDHDNTKQLA